MGDRADRFDRLYRTDPDPWNFRGSPYEREKYRKTLAILPRPRYRLGIEAGCSIGELTRLLSARCDRTIGVDVSEVALAQARAATAGIVFLRADLPQGWPEETADLIVLSEFLYYLKPAEIEALAARIADGWAPDGDCVLVSYLGETGEPLQGAEAADLFIRALADRTELSRTARSEHPQYRIDLLRRPPA